MKRILSFLFFVLCSISSSQIQLIPSGFLNDYAGILNSAEKEEIEGYLRNIEKETTNEIAVVIVKSLEGRNLEEYANEIFNTWKIGKKDKDNGVLILISINERKIRIEVGYGLEPYLTDAKCGRIIRNIMAPEFKNGNFYGGIMEAIKAIDKITKGEIVPSVEKEESVHPAFFIYWFGFLFVFTFAALGFLGVIIQAVVTGASLLLLFLNRTSPLVSFFVLLSLVIPFLCGFLLFMIGIPVKMRIKRKLKKYYGSKWKQHWPVILGSSSGYYTGSGGGFSGGGFGGFGGGGSGGGGASGGW